MKIYIKDTPLRIKRTGQAGSQDLYDTVVKEEDFLINEKKLQGKVLILNANCNTIKSVLFILHNKKPKNLDSVTAVTPHYDEAIAYIKSKFKILKAAGGVVWQNGEVLFIHRLGKWDLPKGKIENGESFRAGAQREVEEECNIKVKVKSKICTTWHTYTKGKKSILKKTVWYLMNCVDDTHMAPQLAEGIDDVRWMDKKETVVALYNAYKSIRHVYKKFRKKIST